MTVNGACFSFPKIDLISQSVNIKEFDNQGEWDSHRIRKLIK